MQKQARHADTTVYADVCDDVMWGTDNGLIPRTILRVQILNMYAEQLTSPHNLAVTVSAQLQDSGRLSGEWLEYTLDPRIVKRGRVISLSRAQSPRVRQR